MKSLIEIASVLLSNGVQEDQILGSAAAGDGIYASFLKGIINERWTTDEEAAKALYGAPAMDERYRQIKFRGRQRLLHFLFDLKPSPEDIDRYRNAHYKCVYLSACGQILMSYSAVHAAADVLESALAIAVEYDLIREGIIISQLLEMHYWSTGKKEKAQQRHDQTNEFLKLFQAEIEADRLKKIFYEIINIIVSFTPELLDKMQGLTDQMEKLATEHPTNHIRNQSLHMRLYNATFRQDYESGAQIAREGLKYYDNNPRFQTRTLRLSLHFTLAQCLTSLRQYDLADTELQQALQYAPAGTANWARVLGHGVLLSFRREEYITAAERINTLLAYIRQGRAAQAWTERVTLYHGYLTYLTLCGLFEPSPAMLALAREFDIIEFLDTTRLANKDKIGLNIARIILHVLLLLAEGNIGGVLSRAESLRQYKQAYLKGPAFTRHAAFIKILHLLIESDFDMEKTEKKGAKYLTMLAPSPEKDGGAPAGLEVIPYDALWEIIKRHIHRLALNGTLAQ